MCIACIRKRLSENLERLSKMDINDPDYKALNEVIQSDKNTLVSQAYSVKAYKGCCNDK